MEQTEGYAILLSEKHRKIENWNKCAEKIQRDTADKISGKHFSVFGNNITIK